MKAISKVEGRVAVLDRPDIDTDQIIPKQFLKRIERTGYGQYAFFDWRFNEDGSERPGFELNQPQFAGARGVEAVAEQGDLHRLFKPDLARQRPSGAAVRRQGDVAIGQREVGIVGRQHQIGGEHQR